MPPATTQNMLNCFLICGLGSLGQHCVLALKQFGVTIIAIEQVKPLSWEIPNVPDLLDDLIIGDCRHISILEQANIHQCRAALIVTTNEQVNAETALAIRQVSPQIRLVVRSAKENLNHLLSEQLGNFVAYEPTELPASAFAIAALGTQTKGFFNLDGQRLRVIQRHLNQQDSWSSPQDLNTSNRRLLAHSTTVDLPSGFYQWEPDAALASGDSVTYIEKDETLSFGTQFKKGKLDLNRWLKKLNRSLSQFWQMSFQQQSRRVALACGFVVLICLIFGTFLLSVSNKEKTLFSAFSTTAILLLGGYADLIGGFGQNDPKPVWLQLFSLVLTLAGTAFVGVLYALLTEFLLSAKFQFANRPPIPQSQHVAIIGLGRVGQRVVALLQEYKQALVGITFNLDFDRTLLPKMPLIIGNPQDALSQANLAQAKSVVVVTDDEILNLEVALMAKKLNPQSHLVIRTAKEQLGQHLLQIFPKAQVIGAYAVAAEAFAGAAFGEQIISLLRLGNLTILVTEYQIEAHDTLNGLLLAEVAYGYGVVSILHQRPPDVSRLMPYDDIRLAVGDRLVILATIDGLRRIEQGRISIAPKQWRIHVEKVLISDLAFDGANAIARVTGCPLQTARDLMDTPPATLSVPLYKHQAARLVRELKKLQVTAKIVPINYS